jgi:Holliday junction resolvase RusA-like endonuclease
MKIVIRGVPIPLKRHRTTKSGIVYDPQKDDKEAVYWLMRSKASQQNFNLPPIPKTQPLHVAFIFFMPIPKSTSDKKKTMLLATPHFKKPDIDNLIKFYLDAGRGLLWEDDSNVSDITALKIYDMDPRVEITIEKL